MKIKVSIIGKDKGYYGIEDCQEYYEDLLAEEGEKVAKEYFREGLFLDSDLEELNGKHFIFGFLECLGQSDNCPYWLFNEDELKYKVEHIKE